MTCPKCGGALKEHYAKVYQPMPFSSAERLKQKGKLTMKRTVYTCGSCGKHFIRTVAYKETEILDD